MFAAALCFSISPSSPREDIPQRGGGGGEEEDEEETEEEAEREEEEARCVICAV